MAFAKLLSSIGVGAATVDTKLESEELSPGEEVRGVVEVRGGSSRQEVHSIRLEVQTMYRRAIDDSRAEIVGTVERSTVSDRLDIQPGSYEELEFSFRLPRETPFSMDGSEVWVQTALDIRRAVDPSDSDRITVRPDDTVQTILDAAGSLGFRLHKSEVEELPRYLQGRLPFAQELEFVPECGEFRDSLDGLEMIVLPSESAVDLILQVDHRGRGLGGLLNETMGTDESHTRLTIQEDDIASGSDHVAGILAETIRQSL